MNRTAPLGSEPEDEMAISLIDLALPLIANAKLLVSGSLLCGAIALGVTYLIAPIFTAATTFLPPQQPQSTAASALASLGALSGLAGAATGIKSPGEQYVSLMQSVSAADRLIDRFNLIDVYDVKYRFEARKELARATRITLGKKDGLITVEVDDENPQRAADLANGHVDELRRITGELALTEAQLRRVFFENQLKQTRDKLTAAQQALQTSGFGQAALRAEPKAAAESYARMKAEITSGEVRVQTLRSSLAETAAEVQQQLTRLAALRSQLVALESSVDAPTGQEYIGKYREFKYQEMLFELFSRQFELARVDESREGALIQVVDVAMAPERKSRPRRGLITMVTAVAAFVLLSIFFIWRQMWHDQATEPATAIRRSRLRDAFHGALKT